MRAILAFALLATLAACGVDGPPEPPTARATPGVSISGEARMGVNTSLWPAGEWQACS